MARRSGAPKDLNKLFRENMAKLRKEKGLSLRSFGSEAGITNVYVYQIEQGQKHPTLETCAKIARALGTTLSEMIKEAPQQGRLLVASARVNVSE
jgi:transcriptional regulator with XRE-family HTH domain